MLKALFRQLVPLIKDENTIFRRRQNDTPSKFQVCQHQVVISHHNVCFLQSVPGTEKRTLVDKATASSTALHGVGGHQPAQCVINRARPAVQVPIPMTARHGLHHGFHDRQGVLHGEIRHLIGIQWDKRRHCRSRKVMINFLQAGITAPAFSQADRKVEATVGQDIRQVPV